MPHIRDIHYLLHMTFDAWIENFSQQLLSYYLKQLRETCETQDAFKEKVREICRTKAVQSARTMADTEKATLFAVTDHLGIDLQLAWKSGWMPTSAYPPAEPAPAKAPAVATGRLTGQLATTPLAPPADALALRSRTADEWAALVPADALSPPSAPAAPAPVVPALRMGFEWPAQPALWTDHATYKQFVRGMRVAAIRMRSVMLGIPPGQRPPTLDAMWKEHRALTRETVEVLRLAKSMLELIERK